MNSLYFLVLGFNIVFGLKCFDNGIGGNFWLPNSVARQVNCPKGTMECRVIKFALPDGKPAKKLDCCPPEEAESKVKGDLSDFLLKKYAQPGVFDPVKVTGVVHCATNFCNQDA